MRLIQPVVIAAIVAVMTGCEKPPPDAGSLVAAIKTDEEKWNADYKNKDAEKITGHYAADGNLFSPGLPKAHGLVEIQRVVEGILSDRALSLSFASDRIETSASGDVAYVSGHYRQIGTDPNTKQLMRETGSYVTVYRKQSDGTWKAAEDINVSDSQPTPAG